MKSVLASTVAVALFASGALAQLTVPTPSSAVQCQPLLINWSGGTAPYFLSILPANQPGAAPLLDFGRQDGNQLTWNVNITGGTQIGLTLRDSTGAIAQSAPFPITPSSDSSCLTGGTPNTSGTTSGTTSATGTTTPGTGTTPGVTTTPATNTTPKPTNTNTTPSGSGTSAPSPSTAAGSIAQVGLTAAVGAAVLALFV